MQDQILRPREMYVLNTNTEIEDALAEGYEKC